MEINKEKFKTEVMNIVSQYAISDIYKSPLVGAYTYEKEENDQLLYLIYPDWNESLEIMSNHGRYFHQLYEDTNIRLKAYTLKKDFIDNNIELIDQSKISICYDRDGIFNKPKQKELVKRK